MFSSITSKITGLSRRPSLRNIVILMTGTVGAQGIVILSSPLLTRLYTPGDMGALTIFISILSPILAFASLRFNSAAQVPKDTEEARSLIHIALGSVFVVAMLTLIFVLAFRHSLAEYFDTPTLDGYLLLLPIAVVTAGTFQSISSWCVRVKAFTVLARATVSQKVATVVLQIALGTVGINGWGLLGGDVAGRFVGFLSQFRIFIRYGKDHSSETVQRDYMSLIKRYRHFPMYSVPPAFMNSVSLALPSFYLASNHGATIVGLYALGQRVLAIPLNIISESVSQVFLSQAAELYWQSVDALAARTKQVWLILMMLGALIVIPIVILAPWLFGLAFGERWIDAGVYVRALSPMLWAQFSFSPLSSVLIPLERQDLFAIRETFRLILLGGALALMVSLNVSDPTRIVQVFGVFGAFTYAFGGALVWYALKAAKNKEIIDAEGT